MTTLDASSNPGVPAHGDLVGMLDWWREAGVDCSFADDAEGWLDAPDAREEAPAPPPPKPAMPPRVTPLQRALDGAERPAIGGPVSAWPQDLASFREFWMSEPSLAEGALATRVAPRGNAGGSAGESTSTVLMILVPQPEDGDRERLLDGPLGALLGGFLRAAGLGDDAIYLASALPRTLPLPDWTELAQRGLGELTRHHIALAKPQRLLAFGRGLEPLLGASDAPPSSLDLPGGPVPLMVAPRLDRLARMPGHRKHFWNQWLEWTA